MKDEKEVCINGIHGCNKVSWSSLAGVYVGCIATENGRMCQSSCLPEHHLARFYS